MYMGDVLGELAARRLLILAYASGFPWGFGLTVNLLNRRACHAATDPSVYEPIVIETLGEYYARRFSGCGEDGYAVELAYAKCWL